MGTQSADMEAFSEFLSKYPAYKDTMIIDSLRREEYPHLDERGQACLDYTGIGLFSSSQKSRGFEDGTDLALLHTSSNLATHAMYVEEGSTESLFRERILRYLNLDEDDYYLVFTANAFSAFKLLGASYPFHEAPNLILSYDHQCENADALKQYSLAKSACVQSVALSFPWCKIDTDDLQKKLQSKKKVSSKSAMKKGLFAFPYSSCVTGCRNSSRWIPRAQQDGWHVLLDVTSVDAKMLDSLGLSIFLPDFIICSFYNVFGEDPTGLGCLAIKKSVLRTLGDSSRARAIGMVKIVNKMDSALIHSSSAASAKRKNEQENGFCLQDSMQHSQLGIPKGSFSCEPEWSADLGAFDSNLFYQSNGHDTSLWKRVLDEHQGPPHSVANGKWCSHENSSLIPTYDGQKADVNTLISHGSIVNRESARATASYGCRDDDEYQSFSMWMADQVAGTSSFRSISTREHNERDLHTSRPFQFQSALSQDDMGIGLDWQRRPSQTEHIEPLSSHNGNLTMAVNRHVIKHVPMEPSTGRNSKGLFYGDVGCRSPAEHTSLRRLFRQETKSRVAAYLQRAGQGHSREVLTVSDWMAYYAAKAKVWSSTSSSASSPAPSYQQFGMVDPMEREICHEKPVGVSMRNRVVCKGLDHADMLGYKRIAVRLRSLADWLMSSLSRLQHPPPKCFKLVKLCSQMSLADRGSTVAFTLLDSSGKAFDLMRVQMLADRNNISIRTGVMEGTLSMESLEKEQHQEDFMAGCVELAGYKCRLRDDTVQQLRLPVLYASLGFLNNFSDVYRLWRFVCRFLDPQFVDQELWHYQALNQETIQI